VRDVSISAGRAAQWLADNNYPYSDNIPLAVSSQEFDGGGQYGVEIPVINSFETLDLTVKLIENHGLYVTRFDETRGSFLLSDAELTDMLELCRTNDLGILISLGPRPEYDIKASFYRSDFGLEMGRQINNNDAIRACAEEALRLAELGCRGLIVYDLGILRLLSRMRSSGFLPTDMVFKTSSHCMATNPFLVEIFADNGVDAVTTAHDLGLPVLQEIRRMNPAVVLDVPTDVYKTKGGFIRFYELAEIVQIAAPVMLKMGASAQSHPYDSVGEKTVRERVQRVARGLEMLDRFLPDKQRIADKSRHRCVPVSG
jgi:Peptidase family U32